MSRLFCGLMAGSVLLANPAFAGDPGLVDGKGRAVAFDTTSKLQREWNAYVKVHGIKRGGYTNTRLTAPNSAAVASIAMTRALIFHRPATSKIPPPSAPKQISGTIGASCIGE